MNLFNPMLRPYLLRVSGASFIVVLAFLGLKSSVLADPGSTFEKIRAALVSKHDQNGDGRLDASEREEMREHAKQNVRQNSRRRGRWSPPKEWIERYDTDGDGELDRQEQGAAFAGEQQRMTQKYDGDQNGRLDAEEKEALKKDFERGAFTGYDRFVAMQVGGIARPERRGRRGGGGFSQAQQRWLEFDADGDGKASVLELEAIRRSMR